MLKSVIMYFSSFLDPSNMSLRCMEVLYVCHFNKQEVLRRLEIVWFPLDNSLFYFTSLALKEVG